MTVDLRARPPAHRIAVIGDPDLPSADAHAVLRRPLHRHHPEGRGSDALSRRTARDELHFSDPGVAAAVAAIT